MIPLFAGTTRTEIITGTVDPILLVLHDRHSRDRTKM
jgi:hypothetical protein